MNKNINLIKAGNLNILRRAFKEKRVATKPQLSELTGLSVVTINSLVNVLLNNGEIIGGFITLWWREASSIIYI